MKLTLSLVSVILFPLCNIAFADKPNIIVFMADDMRDTQPEIILIPGE